MPLIGLLLLFTTLWSQNVRIASYNVENLFDLNREGSEYVEYLPNTSWKWNAANYRIKREHIARVITDIHPDIIALQEIESRSALRDLQKTLQRRGLYFPYSAIADAKNTTVKVALLSRYPITYSKELWVTASRKFRNILEVRIDIDKQPLYLFINHWKAKSGPESERIVSAKAVKKRLYEIGFNQALLLMGDFNSHYEEMITFKKNRKLNDTRGITGINQVLKSYDHTPVNYDRLLTCNDCLYNLWYDQDTSERWSHAFKGSKEALDNMLISRGLRDGKGIEYKRHSFSHFQQPYLLDKKGRPYRWQQSRSYPKHHTGAGFSDHLPIFADFVIKE